MRRSTFYIGAASIESGKIAWINDEILVLINMDKSFLCCFKDFKGTSLDVENWFEHVFVFKYWVIWLPRDPWHSCGHYHGTLWKYNGMSFWSLYASYDVVWRNKVKWFSSNFCSKVGFSCLKTDLPSAIIWWQNQKLALKYVKNVLESKMFSALKGGVVC